MLSEISRKASKFLRLVRKKRVALPHEVQIEITNRCNLDCDMCPRLTILGVPEVDMSEATFERILKNLKEPHSVTLTGWGEPLMHPQFFDFIDRLKARFPKTLVAFTSNAFLLNEARVEAILARDIERLTISLEELPPELFGESAPESSAPSNPKKGHNNSLAKDGHPSSSKVTDNLKRLIAARERSANKSPANRGPEIRLQVVLMPGGQETLLRLLDYAADMGFDAVNLVRLDTRGRPDLTRPSWHEERQLLASARTRAAALGLALSSVNDHGPLMRLAAHADSFCMRLDDYVYITVDGQVSACCLLRNQAAGQLSEQSLQEIWDGPALAKFYGPTLPPECDGCDAFCHNYKDPVSRPESLSV